MSLRECANHEPVELKREALYFRAVWRDLARYWFAVCLVVLLVSPHSVRASESVLLSVTLNGEVKGDYFASFGDGGDILLRSADLAAMGINTSQAKLIEVNAERYVSLKSLPDTTFHYDDKNVALSITVSPSLLTAKSVINLMPARRQDVYYPSDTSVFLNYGLTYLGTSESGFQSFSLTDKAGFRKGDYLFLTDSIYTKTPDQSTFTRLMSNFTYESRPDFQRFIAGDTFASSGDLGSIANIGGLSFSKVYAMDPYFIKQPMLDLKGAALLPSVAEIYVNGALAGSQKIEPGQFELNNFNYYGGSQNVEILIKDSFGNVQRVVKPFYFTDQTLKAGLHEYSYNAGFLRQQFGIESNDYGPFAFSGFHRYGLSDSVNIGMRAEGTRDLVNGGPTASFVIPRAGLISLAFSESAVNHGDTGFATSINHSFQAGRFASRLLLQNYSADYATVTSDLLVNKPRSEASAGISYTLYEYGSLSLDYSSQKYYSGPDRETAAITYSKSFLRNASAFITARRVRETGSQPETGYFVGINFYPSRGTIVSATHESVDHTRSDTVQVAKNVTIGEGWGYRATVTNSDNGTNTQNIVNPYVQYNGPHGIYSANYQSQSGAGQHDQIYSVAASGALVFADDTFGFTRPVNNSFGIVKVDNLEGAHVSLNGLDVGKTDSSGKIIIPEMTSYADNQLSLVVADIPADYQLSDPVMYVSPGQWGGTCLAFDAVRIKAVTGTLVAQETSRKEPIEFYEVTVDVSGKHAKFVTGKGGEFYFENILSADGPAGNLKGCSAFQQKTGETVIKPGSYPASVEYQGKKCAFTVTFPDTADVMTDVGELVCTPEKQRMQQQESPQAGISSSPTYTTVKSESTLSDAAAESAASPAAAGAEEASPAPEQTNGAVESETTLPEKAAADYPVAALVPAPAQVPVETAAVTTPAQTAMAMIPAVSAAAAAPAEKPSSPIRAAAAEPEAEIEDDPPHSFVVSLDFRKGVITGKTKKTLDSVVKILKQNRGFGVEIQVSGDRHGSEEATLRLGLKKAEEIARYLRSAGIKPDRVRKIECAGKMKLLCHEPTTACDNKNRRGIIRIIT